MTRQREVVLVPVKATLNNTSSTSRDSQNGKLLNCFVCFLVMNQGIYYSWPDFLEKKNWSSQKDLGLAVTEGAGQSKYQQTTQQSQQQLYQL